MRRRTYLRTVAAGGTVVAGIGANVPHTVVQTAAAQSASDWSQQAKLSADDGDADDWFGFTVSISGDGTTALVGARDDEDPNGLDAGSAYVFTQSGGEWSQQQKLTPDDGDDLDSFGRSVSLSGNGATALIGAAADEDPNGNRAGSAYVFTQSGGEWSQQQKLIPDDGDDGDGFGFSVSLSGDGTTALIGTQNDDSAYVFTQSGGEWNQQQKLTPDDGDSFGRSVSISGDGTTAIIGAPTDPGQSGNSAYMFTQSGGEWSQQQKLSADDGDNGDRFGQSVSLSGDGTTALIGASSDDDPNGLDAGSAYMFTQSGGEWNQQQKLSADDGDDEDSFGSTVSISGDGTTAIIGAPTDGDPNGQLAGSAYVFTESGGEWSQQQKLSADDGDNGDLFGFTVSISGDGTTAIIGALQDEDPNGQDAGSGYVFASADENSDSTSTTAADENSDSTSTTAADENSDSNTGSSEISESTDSTPGGSGPLPAWVSIGGISGGLALGGYLFKKSSDSDTSK